MQKLQLYISSVNNNPTLAQFQRVDLFKDETVSISLSIQNIKKPDKIFTEFTQTFTIPASKINNKLFEHYYNFDITNGFDARNKREAKIELNNILTDINAKKHYLGAVYDLYAPKIITPPNPAGEWNKYHILIDQKNNYGYVKLNDLTINEFQLRGEKWDSLYAKSKFNKSDDFPYLGDKRWYDFGKFSEGYICFQDHPGKSYFKNIKIRELE